MNAGWCIIVLWMREKRGEGLCLEKTYSARAFLRFLRGVSSPSVVERGRREKPTLRADFLSPSLQYKLHLCSRRSIAHTQSSPSRDEKFFRARSSFLGGIFSHGTHDRKKKKKGNNQYGLLPKRRVEKRSAVLLTLCSSAPCDTGGRSPH